MSTETARMYLKEVSTESAYIIDYEYPIFSLAQIRAYNLGDVKQDRTPIRDSKHGVRLLYEILKFAIFVHRNGSYLFE